MAAQDRINQLQKYMQFWNESGQGMRDNSSGAQGAGWGFGFGSTPNKTDYSIFNNKEAMKWAQSMADAEDKSQLAQAQTRAIAPETAQQMPDFYGKSGNTFNIPAYQAPQYRQSSPMPQHQGGNGIQNMLAELLRSRQPQNTLRQG